DESAKSGESDGVLPRLRAFLGTLPPQTCQRILDALEQARLAGESFPAADMIVAELSARVSETKRRPPRIATPQRYAFALIEPFLIDEHLVDKQAGRIERTSVSAIWGWLSRDLAPEEVQKFEEAVTTATAAGDAERARMHAATFHRTIAPIIRAAVSERQDEA